MTVFQKYLVIGAAGFLLGVMSPWTTTQWQYWAFVAPACFLVGWIGFKLLPSADKSRT